MKPFLLKPTCKNYLWGGQKLRNYGKISDSDNIAESWELSCHPDGESVIASGRFKGMTLSQFLEENPDSLYLHREENYFPVLVKFIDACGKLSIQVHPDNAYAQIHENDAGKMEVWYVVEAEPHASIIYGFQEQMNPEKLRSAVADGTLPNYVKTIPVKKGDIIFIPAGTLHSINEGVMVVEIQQNSNTTYRVYDYQRKDNNGNLRPLHLEKAIDVLNFEPCEIPEVSNSNHIEGWVSTTLANTEYFLATLWKADDENSVFCFGGYQGFGDIDCFSHILVLEGEGIVTLYDGETIPLKKGDSFFIPADSMQGEITGKLTFICTDNYNPDDEFEFEADFDF
ncbi:MAG: type I phosphomannose isomerase catalytic subunit [Oscillospiraceae bacterium]